MNTVTKVYFSPHASFIFLKVARILPTEISPTEISTIYELLLSSPATELINQRKRDLAAQSMLFPDLP